MKADAGFVVVMGTQRSTCCDKPAGGTEARASETIFSIVNADVTFRMVYQMSKLHRRECGFALAEVVVASGLMLFVIVAVYGMQSQIVQLVRSARGSSSASQVLQQRVEQLRMQPFSTVANSTSLRSLMDGTPGATESEKEMSGVSNFKETVTIASYARPSVSPAPASVFFTVTRFKGAATSPAEAVDLSNSSQVNAQLTVKWTDRSGNHTRKFSTIISKRGLTRDGISATSAVPKASSTAGSSTPAPSPPEPSTPPPTPTVCRHGRPWPHCGVP